MHFAWVLVGFIGVVFVFAFLHVWTPNGERARVTWASQTSRVVAVRERHDHVHGSRLDRIREAAPLGYERCSVVRAVPYAALTGVARAGP